MTTTTTILERVLFALYVSDVYYKEYQDNLNILYRCKAVISYDRILNNLNPQTRKSNET